MFLLCMNSDVMTNVILVMGIRMQNHKCNKVENAFPIFKVSRLVRVHTDSHQMVITK